MRPGQRFGSAGGESIRNAPAVLVDCVEDEELLQGVLEGQVVRAVEVVEAQGRRCRAGAS